MSSSTLFGSVSNFFEESKSICFTISILNKDHGSDWIMTSITLLRSLWHFVLYIVDTTVNFQFLFTICKFGKLSQ
jgi:hypothetical protein